jgi:uncharacterized protein (DUF305 family)
MFMAPKYLLATAVLLLCSGTALSQQPVPIQPGSPGEPSKTLTNVTTATATPKPPSEADVRFMQDMIMHHGQAVEMTELAKARANDPDVKGMAEKIDLSQTTEIQYMRQWLTDRGIAPEDPMPTMGPDHSGMSGMDHSSMAGMDHSKMAGMDHSQMAGMDHSAMNKTDGGKDPMDVAMMPGMLTPRQMQALRSASGAKFDELFLTGMMQHHSGALLMVKDLMATPGAAQDPYLFDFAQDVDNGQLAEINIMQNILRKVKP